MEILCRYGMKIHCKHAKSRSNLSKVKSLRLQSNVSVIFSALLLFAVVLFRIETCSLKQELMCLRRKSFFLKASYSFCDSSRNTLLSLFHIEGLLLAQHVSA